MTIELSKQEFRQLLDLVFLGNMVVGLPDPESKESESYDRLTRSLFARCPLVGEGNLVHIVENEFYPSENYLNNGIMNKMMDYEDTILYDVLAEELARRDLEGLDLDGEDNDTLLERMGEYLSDFSANGLDNIYVEGIV